MDPGCRCVVPRCRRRGGGVCVGGALNAGGGGGGGKSRRILASISMGGPNLKS